MALRTSAPADALHEALDMALRLRRDGSGDSAGIVGYGIARLLDGDGKTISITPFSNLITDTGDAYYAAMGIVGVSPAAATAPTLVTGMQIGSGSTTASKAGAGAAMGTLLVGQAFDATFPKTTNLGSGNGVQAVYTTTYAAGVGTGSVQEATITNGTVTTSSVAGNTISRATFTSIAKGAADSLAVTWNHLFQG